MKTIRLTEGDIQRIIKKILKERFLGPAEEQYDWRQIKNILWDYEKGMDDKQIESHVKNLQSHIQELIYVLHNR